MTLDGDAPKSRNRGGGIGRGKNRGIWRRGWVEKEYNLAQNMLSLKCTRAIQVIASIVFCHCESGTQKRNLGWRQRFESFLCISSRAKTLSINGIT